jgi:hypothetical protein
MAHCPLSIYALRASEATAAHFVLALFDLCADIRLPADR